MKKHVNIQLFRIKNLQAQQQDQIAKLESANTSLQQGKRILEEKLAMLGFLVNEEKTVTLNPGNHPSLENGDFTKCSITGFGKWRLHGMLCLRSTPLCIFRKIHKFYIEKCHMSSSD